MNADNSVKIEKMGRKYTADSVVCRIATKKHMLKHPEQVFALFVKAVETLDLQQGVQTDFSCATHGEKHYNYDFNQKGFKALEKRLLERNDVSSIELLYNYGWDGAERLSTLANISWSLDRQRSFIGGEPYSSGSCDTLTFGLDILLFNKLTGKKGVVDFFVQACSEMDVIHGSIDVGIRSRSTEQELLFGFDMYNLDYPLVYCDQYVRGWFWGNVLSEQHIEKLGGIEAILRQAPFEIVKPMQTSDGRELVYLQLTDDVLTQTEADKERADEYLRPLFYSKEVIFEVLASKKTVFAHMVSTKGRLPVERCTAEEMDKLTGLTQEERDQWDEEKKAAHDQMMAEYNANKPVAISPEVEELMEKINTMIMGKIDGWVEESTADYFDQDAMEELLKELEQKAEDALNEELAKHDSEVFSTENKADMLGRALGYAEHSIYF